MMTQTMESILTHKNSFCLNWFQSVHSGRGHSYKFLRGGFLHDIGKYSFSNRVIDKLNQLPEDVVTCTQFLEQAQSLYAQEGVI